MFPFYFTCTVVSELLSTILFFCCGRRKWGGGGWRWGWYEVHWIRKPEIRRITFLAVARHHTHNYTDSHCLHQSKSDERWKSDIHPTPPTPPIWFHSGMCKRLKNKEKRQGYDPDDTTVHRNWTEKTLTFPVTICSTKSMEPPRASRAFSSTVCGKSNCGQFLHFVQFDSVQDDMYVLGKAPIHLLNPISQMFPQHSP